MENKPNKMNDKLQQAKNEIAKEYGYDSFEQFDDKSTFGYDYRTPEIIQRIAERYHELMSEKEPIKTKLIKKGTQLIAIDECKMDFTGENALVVGKSYRVNNIENDWFEIVSEVGEHSFEINMLHEFFKPQPPKQ